MNDTTFDFEFIPVTRMFEQRAEADPDKMAAVSTEKCFTYSELNRAANGVAGKLMAENLGAEDIVLILLERGVDIYAANLGILKAGCAYVIAGMKYPDERIRFILEDSGAKAVVTKREVLKKRGELFKYIHSKVFFIEDMISLGTDENPDTDILPEQLCYCIYTSGSTGRPKGVMIEHGNLTNFVYPGEKNRETMGIIERTSVLLAMAQMTFDVSAMEEFIGLTAGLTVAMASEEEILNAALMKRFILTHRVDGMCVTPAYINALIDLKDMRDAFKLIKVYDFGAEAFPPALYTKITAINPEAYIMNGYGPTEATISCTMQVITDADHVTIGVPNANVYAYVINEKNEELPQGEIGELLICGKGVGRGYINLPEKTRDAFVRFRGMRGYKTGDLACITPEGEIEYHGRKDNQVKLRGLRIELGEIERVLQSVPGVKQAIVRVKKIRGTDHLAAYYVPEGAPLDEKALREAISKRLAEYMMPDYIMALEHFEMTANRKIDDKALPEIVVQPRKITPPRTETEKAVYDVCVKQIAFDGFGVTDALSEIGFTSLTLLGVAAYIYNEYHVDIPLTRMLAANCTIEQICRIIESNVDTVESTENRADAWNVTPQQLPLTLRSSAHQVDRRIVFNGTNAEALRDALVRVVNGAPIFSVNFYEKDGRLWQRPAAQRLSAQDVPIHRGRGDEEDKHAFFTEVGLFDEKTVAFEIWENGSEVELWTRVHHALIDHAGMKLFCDRIVRSYDDPQADMTEKVNYFDYAQSLTRVEKPKRVPNEVPVPTAKTRGFLRKMVTMPADKAGRTDDDLLFSTAAKAAAKALGQKKLVVHYTFGGRNEAKYFDTIGYFPFTVQLDIDAEDERLSYTVGAEVLTAIDAGSPFDDILVRRLQGGERERFILYNYMEVFDREEGCRYKALDEHIDCPEDERHPLITPHLEFNCLSNGKLGVYMLDYDTDTLTNEQAQALLDDAAAILAAEA